MIDYNARSGTSLTPHISKEKEDHYLITISQAYCLTHGHEEYCRVLIHFIFHKIAVYNPQPLTTHMFQTLYFRYEQ